MEFFVQPGRTIVRAFYDGTAKILDAVTGNELAVLKGHEGLVTNSAFSKDGTTVITASHDKTARIWPAQTGQALIDLAKQKLPRCLTREQREAYALEAEAPSWCHGMSKYPYKPRRWGITTAPLPINPILGQPSRRVAWLRRRTGRLPN